MDGMWQSPFVVPVAACAMALGIVAVTKVSEWKTRQLEFEERMAAIAKGLPIPPPAKVEESVQVAGAPRRRGLVRRWGIVLVSAGVGLALFFMTLSWILRERDVLSGASCALVPFAIGIGLLIDARIQTKEIEDGLEIASGAAGGLLPRV